MSRSGQQIRRSGERWTPIHTISETKFVMTAVSYLFSESRPQSLLGEEGLRQVYSWIDSFVKNNHEIADKINLGKSEDNKWDIPAVIVTNKSISAGERQNAIVSLTRHGQ